MSVCRTTRTRMKMKNPFHTSQLRVAATHLVSILMFVLVVCETTAADRLRVMVETDAGGDPDDEQSLVRLLLYANEWDIEGIIANRPRARDGENKNTERT